MLFQLAMTVLRGIVDPDNFIGGKNNAGGFVYRVLISLVLFSLLIPINTSKSNEYEKSFCDDGSVVGISNRIC